MRQVSFIHTDELDIATESKSVREEHFVQLLGDVPSYDANVVNLPPVGKRLNASKSKSMLASQ